MVHAAARNGTTYKSEGVWYRASRDVPTAALLTYVDRIADSEKDKVELPSSLKWLVEAGRNSVTADADDAHKAIHNMLGYFINIGSETNAAYQCAAIHAGMITALLGAADSDEVQSYVHHLSCMDHRPALEKGRRRVDLQL